MKMNEVSNEDLKCVNNSPRTPCSIEYFVAGSFSTN